MAFTTPAASRPAGTPETTVLTRGFDRRRFAVVLLVVTVAVAVFMQVGAHAYHGVGAAAVLTVASAALLFAGGPDRRARRVVADREELVVERWTRVVTRVAWSELARVEVVDAAGKAGLLLVPRDRTAFFDNHLELRDSATAEGALIPLGGRAGVAEEVRGALAARGV
ncbi:hypothetical protein [Mariniluteicoccus flavus]